MKGSLVKNFELEAISENIHSGKTKEYFEEVVTSYQNQCYRSSVVMLWSVVICDLVYKLQNLVDQYGDTTASSILEDIKKNQKDDPKSPNWELKLLDDVYNKTDFVDSSEYENLRYLQKQRHLSAHPVLRQNLELYKPNKETVRSLIRNALEGVLIKPPFYTQKVISELIEDLDEAKAAINSFSKLKRYISSRYLDRLSPDVEMVIFKTIWKFAFKLSNDKCKENRQVNLWVIRSISERHPARIIKEIKGNNEAYSNIAASGEPLNFLMFYLTNYPEAYSCFSEDAKLKIKHAKDSSIIGKLYGWFIDGDLSKHFDFLCTWFASDEHPTVSDQQWEHLLKLSDSDEWEETFSKLITVYYCTSRGFDTADRIFVQLILPYLKFFTKDSAVFMLENIETNRQIWDRSRAVVDHPKLKAKFDTLLGKEFDYKKYPRFYNNTKTPE
jgi:hypothetical protein